MKKCALVVGHKPDKPGACNEKYNVCEYEVGNELVDDIIDDLVDYVDPQGGLDIVKVLRNKYSDLPFEINTLNPDFIVSFHANSFNKKATGTETLYCYGSSKGEKLARTFQRNMVRVLELNDRGVIPKREKERGGHLLVNTKAPCVILEPFFIDNDKDFLHFMDRRDSFIKTIHKSLYEVVDWI